MSLSACNKPTSIWDAPTSINQLRTLRRTTFSAHNMLHKVCNLLKKGWRSHTQTHTHTFKSPMVLTFTVRDKLTHQPQHTYKIMFMFTAHFHNQLFKYCIWFKYKRATCETKLPELVMKNVAHNFTLVEGFGGIYVELRWLQNVCCELLDAKVEVI